MRTEAPSAKISELREGEAATVCAYVRNADTRMQKNRLSITNVRICDETGEMQISVFNGKYPPPALRRGELCAFYGKISRDSYGFHMTNPVFSKYASGWNAAFFTIQPVYPLTRGLTQNLLRGIIAEALKTAPPEYETLPIALLQKYRLMPRGSRCRTFTSPDRAELEESRRRLKFEELFTMQLMLLLLKDAEALRPGTQFPFAAPLQTRKFNALPKRFLLRCLKGRRPYGKKSRKIWMQTGR